MPTAERLPLFAVTAPGLETVAASELADLGITAAPEPGGAAWDGTLEELYDANLRSRTASRILLRVAEFRARTFFELERHARRIPWERFVAPGRPVRFRVTARKSRLYHEGAIAQRLLEAVEHRTGPLAAAPDRRTPIEDRGPAAHGAPTSAPHRPASDEDDGDDAQLFVVRFLRDHCTLSADTSGALLHRRGYRQALAKAPLRETLAAAMLLAARWDPDAPLLDPMCGSGTIAIEGALLARRIAPGLANPERHPRDFAFRHWPDFDAGAWDRVVDRAAAAIRPGAPTPILASDRDAGAIRAAHDNASRAGVLDDLGLDVRPLSAVEPPAGPGWLITNPPYGTRIGERRSLRDLYAALGNFARRRLPGWTIALLSPDRALEAQLRIPLAPAFDTRNGGIPVRLAVGRVEGSFG